RIVKPPVVVAGCFALFDGIGLVSQPAVLRLGHDPTQRNMRKRVVGITAADVGMNARKPDLADTLLLGLIDPVGIARRALFIPLGPYDGVKGRALVIEGQCMAGTFNLLAEPSLGKLERPDPLAHPSCHLVHGKAIRRNRVPQTEKADLFHSPVFARVVRIGYDQVASKPERLLDAQERVEVFPAKRAIGVPRPPVQLLLAFMRDETLIEDQADDDADGESASAESEAEDFVFARAIVATSEFVEIEN